MIHWAHSSLLKRRHKHHYLGHTAFRLPPSPSPGCGAAPRLHLPPGRRCPAPVPAPSLPSPPDSSTTACSESPAGAARPVSPLPPERTRPADPQPRAPPAGRAPPPAAGPLAATPLCPALVRRQHGPRADGPPAPPAAPPLARPPQLRPRGWGWCVGLAGRSGARRQVTPRWRRSLQILDLRSWLHGHAAHRSCCTRAFRLSAGKQSHRSRGITTLPVSHSLWYATRNRAQMRNFLLFQDCWCMLLTHFPLAAWITHRVAEWQSVAGATGPSNPTVPQYLEAGCPAPCPGGF